MKNTYPQDTEVTPRTRRKPGKAAPDNLMRTSVYLEPELIDWAKHQPGGLSERVRFLLRRDMEAKQ